jgi:hypothetical protein
MLTKKDIMSEFLVNVTKGNKNECRRQQGKS